MAGGMFKKLREKIADPTNSQSNRTRNGAQGNDSLQSHISRNSSISSLVSDASNFAFNAVRNSNSFNNDGTSNSRIDLDSSSDLGSVVEELSPGSSVNAPENVSKQDLWARCQHVQGLARRYKSKFYQLEGEFKQVQSELEKVRSVLTDSQDKSLRRMSELREQIQLDQQAKRDIEENYQHMLVDKEEIISCLKLQVSLLREGKDLPPALESRIKELHEQEVQKQRSQLQEVARLTELVQKREDLLRKCKDRIRALQAENEAISQEMSTLRSQNQSSVFNESKSISQEEVLVDLSEDSHSEVSHLKQEIQRLQMELQHLRETVNVTNKPVTDEDSHYLADSSMSSQSFTTQPDFFSTESMQSKIFELQNQLQSVINEKTTLEQQLQAVDIEKMETIRLINDQLNMEWKQKVTVAEEMKASLEVELNALQKNLDDLTQKCQERELALQEAHHKLQQASEQHQDVIKCLNENLSTVVLQNAPNELHDTHEQINLKEQIHGISKVIATLQDEVESAKREKEDVMNQKCAENDFISTKCREFEQEREKYQQEINNLLLRLDTLQGDFNQREIDKTNEFNKKIDQLNDEVRHLQELRSQLEVEIVELKENLVAKEKERIAAVDDLQKEFDRMKENLKEMFTTSLQEEHNAQVALMNAESKSKEDDMQSLIETLENKVASLEDKLRLDAESTIALENEKAEVMKIVSDLRQENSGLSTSLLEHKESESSISSKLDEIQITLQRSDEKLKEMEILVQEKEALYCEKLESLRLSDETISKLTADVTHMEEELQITKSDKLSLLSENQHLLESCTKLETDISQLKELLSRTENELLSAREVSTMNQDETAQKIHDLGEEIRNVTEQREQLIQQVELLRQKNEENLVKLSIKEDEERSLKEQIECILTKESEMKEVNQKNLSDLEQLCSEKENVTKMLQEELKEECSKVKNLQEALDELEKKYTHLTDEKELLSSRLEMTEGLFKTHENDSLVKQKDLEDKCKELETKYMSIEQELGKKISLIEELESSLSRICVEKDTLQEQLVTQKEKLLAVEDERDSLNKKLDDALLEIARTRDLDIEQRGVLQTELNELKDSSKSLQEEASLLRSEKERLEVELLEFTQNSEHLKKQIEEMNTQLAVYETEKHELSETVKKQEEALNLVTFNLDGFTKASQEQQEKMQCEKEELVKKVTELDESLSDKLQNLHILQNENGVLKEQLNLERATIMEVQQKCDHLEIDIDSYQKREERHVSNITSLELQLADLNQEHDTKLDKIKYTLNEAENELKLLVSLCDRGILSMDIPSGISLSSDGVSWDSVINFLNHIPSIFSSYKEYIQSFQSNHSQLESQLQEKTAFYDIELEKYRSCLLRVIHCIDPNVGVETDIFHDSFIISLLESFQAWKSDQERKIVSMEEKLNEMKDQMRHLNLDLEKSRETICVHVNENASLNERLQELQETSHRKGLECQRLQQSVNTHTEQLETYQDDLKSIQREKEEAIQMYQTKCATLEERVTSLEGGIKQELATHNLEMQRVQEDYQNEVENIRQEHTEKMKQLSHEFEEKMANKEKEFQQTFEEALERVRSDESRYREEKMAEILQLQKTLEEKEVDRSQMQKRLSEVQQSFDATLRERALLQETVEVLQRDCDQQSEEMETLQKRIKQFEETIQIKDTSAAVVEALEVNVLQKEGAFPNLHNSQHASSSAILQEAPISGTVSLHDYEILQMHNSDLEDQMSQLNQELMHLRHFVQTQATPSVFQTASVCTTPKPNSEWQPLQPLQEISDSSSNQALPLYSNSVDQVLSSSIFPSGSLAFNNRKETLDSTGSLDNISLSQRPVALTDAAEYEYLKNILYEYMMGHERRTLARVLCTVLKFSKEQTKSVMLEAGVKDLTWMQSPNTNKNSSSNYVSQRPFQ